MDALAVLPDAPVTTEPDSYTPTHIERRLYAALTALGIAYKAQWPVGWYTLDAYVPARRLAIEVDGCSWHGCLDCGWDSPWDRYKRTRDRVRDERLLRGHAIYTLRIPGHDMGSDAEAFATVRAVLLRHGIALEGRSASA